MSFIADLGGLRRPDHLTSQRVTVTEPWHVMTAQDPADCSGRDSQLGSQHVRALPEPAAGFQNPFLDLSGGPLG